MLTMAIQIDAKKNGATFVYFLFIPNGVQIEMDQMKYTQFETMWNNFFKNLFILCFIFVIIVCVCVFTLFP